jgi:hypothetical protein
MIIMVFVTIFNVDTQTIVFEDELNIVDAHELQREIALNPFNEQGELLEVEVS